MSNSTTKKVYVRRKDHALLAGYVMPQTYLRPDGVEMIGHNTAEVMTVPYEQVKAIYFVREFDGDPEADKKVFASRPKLDGLWVRLTFLDGEMMEGVLPNNLLPLMAEHGLALTPPEANSNTQRVFVPRAALKELQVLGVIGSPVHAGRKRREPSKEQMDLFEGAAGARKES